MIVFSRNLTIATFAALGLAGCYASPSPIPQPPPPQAVPSVVMKGPPSPAPDDWNLFPDPTTGEVEVYHKGNLVGAVTGNEPAAEDPPQPHPTDATRDNNQDSPNATP